MSVYSSEIMSVYSWVLDKLLLGTELLRKKYFGVIVNDSVDQDLISINLYVELTKKLIQGVLLTNKKVIFWGESIRSECSQLDYFESIKPLFKFEN